ncbi:hypothetical protein ACWC4J_11210 [Streptomyces sp. NPDC001356]
MKLRAAGSAGFDDLADASATTASGSGTRPVGVRPSATSPATAPGPP